MLLSLCLIVSLVRAAYRHKIEPFSFDIQKFEYPLEWTKWGTTVALKDTVKVLPKVENRYGGLFMSQVSALCLTNLFVGSQWRLTGSRWFIQSTSRTTKTRSTRSQRWVLKLMTLKDLWFGI